MVKKEWEELLIQALLMFLEVLQNTQFDVKTKLYSTKNSQPWPLERKTTEQEMKGWK